MITYSLQMKHTALDSACIGGDSSVIEMLLSVAKSFVSNINASIRN